ncbi:unnamed protein product [Adineta steineri]|uniref:Uncharacterized protein n=1 Tax=Adineta steineri TaxID=433720 RepID=A0A819MEA6_9BILA|nr:unnamed protein product [Adineta steineri]
MNVFNYTINADNLPEELEDCEIANDGSSCSIDVYWHENPIRTEILLEAEGKKKEIDNLHMLYIDIGLEGDQPKLERGINYECATNDCNSLMILKNLLSSLTFNDKFEDLAPILYPTEPFDSHWCGSFSNSTSISCYINPSPELCHQCSITWMNTMNHTEICSVCDSPNILHSKIFRTVNFNMTNRVRYESREVQCRSKDCGLSNIIEEIGEKSTIIFDLDKFLNPTSHSMRTVSNDFSKIIFTLILLIKKYFID